MSSWALSQEVGGIAKWSLVGPLAMSELESGSLVVQRCLCCLLGMCVFLVVGTLFATVGRSVTCSSGFTGIITPAGISGQAPPRIHLYVACINSLRP